MKPRACTRSHASWLIAAVLLVAGALAFAGAAHASENGSAASASTQPAEAGEAPEDLNLSGILYDVDTDQRLPNVTLHLDNVWIDEQGDGEAMRGGTAKEFVTDEDGAFEANVSDGEIMLRIEEDGYHGVRAHFDIQDDVHLEVPMEPLEEDPAHLEGTIVSTDGDPIEDARIDISPNQDDDHAGPDQRTLEADGHQIQLRYRVGLDTHAWERTDEDGSFSAQLAPGAYTVRTHAPDHVANQAEIELAQGQTHQEEIVLKAVPDATVAVEGTVVDAETGEPLPGAHVDIVNDRWGEHARVYTDQDGAFQADTVPGPLLVNARADREDSVPCDHAPNDAEEIYRDRCRLDRAHDYLPNVQMVSADDGEQVTLEIQLPRAPAHDATLSGWVINETSQEGIQNATVTVRNEVTGDWGQATTDEDGSFVIEVQAGYYTIRAQHPEHPDAGINAELDAGEEAQITIEAPPGPAHDRHPHVMPVDDTAARHDEHPEPEPMHESDEAYSSSGGMAEATPQETGNAGTQAYESSEEGLGPYPGGQQEAPLVSVAGTIALVILGAVGIQLWVPRRS